MRYFKNKELINLYNVSDKAIRNWIRASKEGRVELELVVHNGRTYVADTLQNSFALEGLVELGKKYRNRRTHKVVSPSKEFYSLYTLEQVMDIANNLDTFRELPHQYRYHGADALYWDEYLKKLYSDGRDNTLIDTITLLEDTRDYLERIIKDYPSVNVIDVGVGNGLVVKAFLQHLQKADKLKRYVGVDTSPQLLDITESNLREWCGPELKIERYTRDITYQSLVGLTGRYSQGQPGQSMNIFLFLGGTITNFRSHLQPLYAIRDSMSKEDILLTSLKLDGEKSRRFFDFRINGDRRASLPEQDVHALNLLGIEEAFYDSEQFYDVQRRCRFIQVKLRVGVSLRFKVRGFEKLIEIPKGERILLWKIAHFDSRSLEDLYLTSGFEVLQSTKSRSQDYLLLTTKLQKARRPDPPNTSP